MKYIRAVFRLLSASTCTLTLSIIYGLGRIPLAITGLHYEPWRNFILRVWSKGLGWILNLRVITEGEIPEPPFFLVSNHLSYLDILALFQHLKCTFIAREDVRKWPVIGFIVFMMGIIFIDRSRKKDVTRVNRLVSDSLNRYQGIILFPEGTTSDGSGVLPFRPPLLEHPARTGLPVHTATFHYRTSGQDPPANLSVCWSGEISFADHIWRIVNLNSIICTIRFGDRPVKSNDRKILAEELHSKVMELFIPVSDGPS